MKTPDKSDRFDIVFGISVVIGLLLGILMLIAGVIAIIKLPVILDSIAAMFTK